MPEHEELAVTSSSPLIASETIEETTIQMGNEGDMMNDEDDKENYAGVNPNKMMYTSTEESEFYKTSPETTTDDTEIISRSSMSYEKEQVTTKENREKVDDEERSVELDNEFYDIDIITTTPDNIIGSEQIYSEYQYDDYSDSDYGQRDSKHLSLKSTRFSPNNYNTLVKTILVPNQIAPRVAAECFRFDCLSKPSHHCCSPHPAIKRHTEEHNYNDDFIDKDIENIEDKNKLQYMNSRVTATITRVLKSISWL